MEEHSKFSCYAPRAEYQKPGAYWQARRMRTQLGAKQIAFHDNCHNEEETLEWDGSIQIMANLKTNGCVSLTRKAFLAAALSAVVEYPTCIFPCNIPDKSRLVTWKNKKTLYQVKQFNRSYKMRMLWKLPLERGMLLALQTIQAPKRICLVLIREERTRDSRKIPNCSLVYHQMNKQ